MKRWSVALAFIVVIGLVAIGMWARRDNAGGDADQSANNTPGVSAKELQALRQEVELLKKHAVASPDLNSTSAAVSSASPVVTAGMSKLDVEQHAKERAREALTNLEARFAGERIDAAWNLKTVREIRDVIGRSATNTQLVEAECASTLCRLVVSHGTEEAQKELASKVAAQEPFRTGVVYDYDFDSNPRKTTLFVLRQGHSFNDDAQGH